MSNANLIDLDNAPGSMAELKADLSAATTVESNPTADPSPNATPDKYKDKNVADVIDMHRNAESALGRSNNELGQYKQLTDKLLDLKRHDDLVKGGASETDIEEVELPQLSSTDLLDNPTEAVAKVVDARLTADARKRERDEVEATTLREQQQFADAHPDAAEIANSPEFVKWVGNSALRLRAAREAFEGDNLAGIELLDEYKAGLQSPEATEAAVKEEERIQKARAAGTVSAGSSQTTDAPKGKIYRRLDLIRLKIEDPEAYGDPSFQQEIMRAYTEGRVK